MTQLKVPHGSFSYSFMWSDWEKPELQLFCAVTQFIKPGTGHDGHFWLKKKKLILLFSNDALHCLKVLRCVKFAVIFHNINTFAFDHINAALDSIKTFSKYILQILQTPTPTKIQQKNVYCKKKKNFCNCYNLLSSLKCKNILFNGLKLKPIFFAAYLPSCNVDYHTWFSFDLILNLLPL